MESKTYLLWWRPPAAPQLGEELRFITYKNHENALKAMVQGLRDAGFEAGLREQVSTEQRVM